MHRNASESPPSANGGSDGDTHEANHDSQHQAFRSREDYVSLVDLLLIVLERRRLVLWTTVLMTVCGGVYAILATESYVSNATVIREASGETPSLGSMGGLSALQGFGMNLGLHSGGLTPSAYPKVLESREVRLAVARDTFYFPDVGREMTLVEYANQPPGVGGMVLKYTLKLPWTLKEMLADAMRGERTVGDSNPHKPGSGNRTERRLSEREYAALKRLDEMMETSVDDATSLMTITITAKFPAVASDVADRFVIHLRERIQTLRTAKVREQLAFLDDRFHDVQAELNQAEEALARFLQRNQNPTTATLQFEQDRLRRQVSFKEQLYSQLQGQLAQTRLEVRRQQPVVTVVETAVTPIERASPARTLIVILSLIFGIVLAAGLAIFLHFVSRHVSEEEQVQFRNILHDITPAVAHRLWRSDDAPSSDPS